MSPEEVGEQTPVAPARKKTTRTRTPRSRPPKADQTSESLTDNAVPLATATATTVLESDVDRRGEPGETSTTAPVEATWLEANRPGTDRTGAEAENGSMPRDATREIPAVASETMIAAASQPEASSEAVSNDAPAPAEWPRGETESQAPLEPVHPAPDAAAPPLGGASERPVNSAAPAAGGWVEPRSEPQPRFPRSDRQGDRSRRRDPRQGRPDTGDRQNGTERASFGAETRDRQGPPTAPRPRPERGPSGPPATGKNGSAPHLGVIELDAKPIEALYEMARTLEIQGYTRMTRGDLLVKLLRAQTEQEGNIFGDGVLEIIEDGFGFLRGTRFLPGPDDIYVSQSQIRRFGLRTGDRVSGQVRPPKDNEKFFSLLRVEVVNGVDPETARRRPSFDTLTPIFPLERIDLETQPNILATRLLNLVAPIGRGQRGLIVSPPKAGKTMLLKSIANGITANCPDMHLMVCLIGERPEEVTDMRRSIDGEVISSTFDEPVEDHTKVAETALERAKRLVEGGRDVTILLDSITRLARAYNLAVPPSGRTLSGGIDPVALYPPKRFFGAARNIEGGGSLTIVSTCLIDTGSRMDDVIYEEFKGTGNMELHLDRKLAERRIYPSIDVQRSGTRREELLLDEYALRQVWTMRRMVSMLGGSEGTELLLSRLAKTTTNAEFLETLNRDL